jgi:ABC-type nitrate/sulfonate/bicarbonate transport system substrate-binding protein
MMIYHVNRTWAKNNRDKVEVFVKAHNKAAKYMLDPKNKQEVCEILAKVSNTSIQDALRTYDVVMKVNGIVADGSISASTVMRVLNTLAADGDLKTPLKSPSTFFDPQYVEATR